MRAVIKGQDAVTVRKLFRQRRLCDVLAVVVTVALESLLDCQRRWRPMLLLHSEKGIDEVFVFRTEEACGLAIFMRALRVNRMNLMIRLGFGRGDYPRVYL